MCCSRREIESFTAERKCRSLGQGVDCALRGGKVDVDKERYKALDFRGVASLITTTWWSGEPSKGKSEQNAGSTSPILIPFTASSVMLVPKRKPGEKDSNVRHRRRRIVLRP